MATTDSGSQSLINNPLDEIQRRLTASISRDELPQKSNADWGLKQDLKNAIACYDSKLHIPFLNFKSFHSGMLQNHSLVRYRGFVQDMFEPEFFVSSYKPQESSEYINASYADVDIPNEINYDECVKERLPLFCMPRRLSAKWNGNKGEPSTICQMPPPPPRSSSLPSSEDGEKRQCSSQDRQTLDDENEMNVDLENQTEETNKRHQVPTFEQRNETNDNLRQKNVSFHSYLNQQDDLCCIVKLYDDDMQNTVKINDVIEFIGVLDASPVNGDKYTPLAQTILFVSRLLLVGELDASYSDFFGEEEVKSHHPPSSLVPRLHCLLLKPITEYDEVICHSHYCNLLDETPRTEKRNESQGKDPHLEALAASKQWQDLESRPCESLDMMHCYKRVLVFLTNACGGDNLAAQYLLACLCCQVTARSEEMPLGFFPLNLIFNVNNASLLSSVSQVSRFASWINEAVDTLVPRSLFIGLDQEQLESDHLFPSKDYAANRLCRSLLQLPSQTCIVVDESKLDKLSDHPDNHLNTSSLSSLSSLSSIEASSVVAQVMETVNEQNIKTREKQSKSLHTLTKLKQLTETQELSYDFQFYQMNFKTDFGFILCSQNSDSLINSSCPLVVKPRPGFVPEEFLNEYEFNQLRLFLISVKRAQVTGFENEQVAQRAEDDMVTLKQGDATMTSGCLSRLLTMSRLAAAYERKTAVSQSHWDATVALEDQRRQRLQSY